MLWQLLFYSFIKIGLPKAAVVTHAKVIKGSLLMRMVGVGKDDTVYTPLPLYHSAAGIVALGNTVLQGNKCIKISRDVKTISVDFI